MSAEIGNFEGKAHSKDLVLKRIVKAPRELVFQAFTRAEHLAHWWAPKPYTTTKCEVDLRPGGFWRYTFRSPEGMEHDCEAIYREVDPPRKFVMEASVPGPNGQPFFVLRQTIILEEKGNETGIIFDMKILQANPGAEPFLGGMKQGTDGTLNNLVEYLSKKS